MTLYEALSGLGLVATSLLAGSATSWTLSRQRFLRLKHLQDVNDIARDILTIPQIHDALIMKAYRKAFISNSRGVVPVAFLMSGVYLGFFGVVIMAATIFSPADASTPFLRSIGLFCVLIAALSIFFYREGRRKPLSQLADYLDDCAEEIIETTWEGLQEK